MTTNESFSNLHEQPQWIPGLQLSASIFYTFIVLIGITGNILVLVIVLRYRDMRNATNYLLANLSVADLAVLIFCSPDGYQHLYGKDKHRLGDFMCKSPIKQKLFRFVANDFSCYYSVHRSFQSIFTECYCNVLSFDDYGHKL